MLSKRAIAILVAVCIASLVTMACVVKVQMDTLSREISLQIDSALHTLPQLRPALPTNIDQKQAKLRQEIMRAEVLLRPLVASRDVSVAQEMAKALLTQLRFDGAEGYFYVYALDGRSLVHPLTPSIVGTNQLDRLDEDGLPVVRRLLEQAGQPGGGFVTYKWENPTTHRISRKYGYATLIPQWGWMIGTGVYFNDVEAALLHLHDALDRTGHVKTATITIAGAAFILLATLTSLMLSRSERQKLHRLRQEADLALAGRSQFFNEATHDFAQRLHALRLLAYARQSEGTMRDVSKMSEALEDLDVYVRDVLEFARIESHAIDPKCKTVVLQSVFQQLLLNFESAAEARGVELRIRTTEAVIQTDEAMLLRVLENVVSNAIKFTRRRVLVAARARGNTWRVEVWDQGSGIPPGTEQAIFRAFYQHPVQVAGRREGVGLGLAIVQRLTARLNYRLAVHSREGRGTLIRISDIPARRKR